MAVEAKLDQVKKDALPKPPGAEPNDKPVRAVRNPNSTTEKKWPERRS